MSDIEIRVLDATDEAQLRAYWEVGKASTARLPFDHWPAWELSRRTWSVPNHERDLHFLGAFVGERVVGGAWIGLPLLDNRHLMHFELFVRPEERRRGVGTALLAQVEALAAEAGRTTYLSDTVRPSDAECPGEAFGRARGYDVVGTDECKVVELVEQEPHLPRLARLAAQRLGGYTLLTVDGRAPDELLDDLCALSSRFLEEIPLEGVDLRPQTWDPERYRAAEDRRVAAGRRALEVVARSPAGRLVGMSDLTSSSASPERADIGSTLVLPEHRGHRLGLAMKVRLHQLVRAELPDVRRVVTWNSGVNEHMNAVNEQLGYRLQQTDVGLQKKR